MCRERLCLGGTAQPIDWNQPPNLPEIWTQRPTHTPAVLQSNVDAVIAQVYVAVNMFQACSTLLMLPLLALAL